MKNTKNKKQLFDILMVQQDSAMSYVHSYHRYREKNPIRCPK